jgi:hypothetical protein
MLRGCEGRDAAPPASGQPGMKSTVCEKIRNFHAMETFWPIFPRHGKSYPRRGTFSGIFSTLWKKFSIAWKFRKIAAAALALAWAGGEARAATWGVATNGSDAAAGTVGAPFRTIARALQAAVDGDAVELRGGTYREAGEVRFRRPGVTLRSAAGEWAVIEAPVDDEDQFAVCVWIDPDADRTTLSRLEIVGGAYYGVVLQTKWDWGDPNDREGACHVTIEDCVIRGTGRDGIKITPNCDDVLIQRCEIYDTGIGPLNASAQNAEGIDCVNGDRVTIRDCHIHDVFSTGIYLKGGATDGLIERTRVERCGAAGIMLGFDTSPEYFDLGANPSYYENIRGTVRNCVVRDTGWEGIGMYAASNPVVYNNTLVDVCTGNVHAAIYFGLTFQDWDPGAGRPASVGAVIRNNLIAQPAGFADETFEIRYANELGGMSALAGWPSMDHNGFFVAGGGAARFSDRRPGSTLDGGSLAQWRAHSGADGRSRTDDPLFADAAGGNYALAANSPYVDAGTNAAWMAGATDFAGAARIAGGTVDVGALEFGSAAPWDAGHVPLGGGWRRLGWFGDYVPLGTEGWIWHSKHGFFFVAANAAPADVWLYAQDMGWLWTGDGTYPFLYRHNDGAWLWYNGATGPRWFRNMTAGTWEWRP